VDQKLGDVGWPPSLLERAVIAGSGEPLWPAAELPPAVEWAQESSLAIVGIEVFGKVDLARGVFQRELPIEPGWSEGESWSRYVARSAATAREQLSADLASEAARAADLYFLAVVPEASLRRLGPR
jgi:hypothetical protein